ncbi:trypsin-like cysteine/serine peptidase domain-containing protein [Globomyces pollinis-pini]|nr:trypsin-like cysteine/serine peptidase domain-containing protein [Globomyces pollinis-pini]
MKFTAPLLLAATAFAAPTEGPIVGGTPVGSAEKYPWLVSIQKNGSQFCGGILLSPTKVLTAAHCTKGQTPTGFKIFAHRYDFATTAASEKAAEFKVLKQTTHPSYVDATKGNDAAVWEVQLVSGTAPTTKIVLDSAGPVTDANLIIAGWGTLSSGGSIPKKMQEAVVPVNSAAVCTKAYPQTANVPTSFCAGYAKGGIDTCQGDSGGPAFFNNEDGSVTIVGLTSWGQGCALANYPGVYSKVSALASWIKSV